MKRLFAALLSLVLALLLMGCSSAPANDPTPGQADAPVEDKTDLPAGEQSNDSTGGKEDTNADDTGRDAQNTGEGQVGDYAVKITGVRVGKDYDCHGEPVFSAVSGRR